MALKYFYYVLVLSEGQAKFVTKTDYATKTAYWDSNENRWHFQKRKLTIWHYAYLSTSTLHLHSKATTN